MARYFEAHAAESAYNAHYDRPSVLELLGDVRGKQVLDACCGPGFYTEELVSRGATVTAFDASAPMVDLARQRLGTAAKIHLLTLGEPLPFPDDSFDAVVCALAIHYVDDRTGALRELRRVLKRRGSLVLSTQHPTTDWIRKGGSYFDIKIESDVWGGGGQEWEMRFWREPLTALCGSIADAGFLIERLVEPLPTESMRALWPSDYETLMERPGFLLLRLLNP